MHNAIGLRVKFAASVNTFFFFNEDRTLCLLQILLYLCMAYFIEVQEGPNTPLDTHLQDVGWVFGLGLLG